VTFPEDETDIAKSLVQEVSFEMLASAIEDQGTLLNPINEHPVVQARMKMILLAVNESKLHPTAPTEESHLERVECP
jgi:hypothetical protein